MIEFVQSENFQCFADVEIPLGWRTLLNGTGKRHSTIRTDNKRVYFFDQTEIVDGTGDKQKRIVIGYVGPHLPTIKYN